MCLVVCQAVRNERHASVVKWNALCCTEGSKEPAVKAPPAAPSCVAAGPGFQRRKTPKDSRCQIGAHVHLTGWAPWSGVSLSPIESCCWQHCIVWIRLDLLCKVGTRGKHGCVHVSWRQRFRRCSCRCGYLSSRSRSAEREQPYKASECLCQSALLEWSGGELCGCSSMEREGGRTSSEAGEGEVARLWPALFGKVGTDSVTSHVFM
jgi:hypothetical protein